MNILFVGDIVGKVGRKALLKNLSFVKGKFEIDFAIANGENISNGRGMNENHYNFLVQNGVNCITLGNHYNDRDEIKSYINFADEVVRPLNLKDEYPGEGSKVFEVNGIKIRVTNLLGSAFSKFEVKDPYQEIIKIISEDESDIHIIDFHAEATGEKKAFAYALKDTVSAVIGTHTHVQTNDAQILNTGVFYMSDVGMCGSYNSVLGDEINSVVERVILHNDKARFKLLEDDDSLFNAVVLKFDDITLRPQEIVPISILNRKVQE